MLTKDNCIEAENTLKPLEKYAKQYNLILAAHAHIDMNWMWGFQETVAATLSTFRTMLNIMDEYPDFCFSQSQASVYKIVEDYDPELMIKIKEKIKNGQWEITANAWVETDKNMPNTESLLKHIKYTRKYLKEHWEIDVDSIDVDFSPDTFGHNANVPEINSFGNVKYYYHCRGLDGDNALYKYKSPSGKEILVCREQYWYNSAITPKIALGLVDISKRNAGLKTGLIVYGVGNHGGGPTRRDVERAIEMQSYPIFPNIKFGTLKEFFKIAETVKDKLPTIDHELNYFASGCYTTQSRIKLGNRKCELALNDAQIFSTMANYFSNKKYMFDHFEKAWQKVLFTHFHDILTGSCVIDSREHAMGLFSEAMAVANTQSSNSLRIISENIDTSSIEIDENIFESQSEGAGAGYGISNYSGIPSPERGAGLVRIFNVFNSMPIIRKETIEITVWDWVGDLKNIVITDKDNNKLDFALLDNKLCTYWDHKYFRMIVEVTVPSLGYTTIVLKEEEINFYRHYMNNPKRSEASFKNFILENEFIYAEFDSKNGNLLSLKDKADNIEMVSREDNAQLKFINTESASSSAWNIGRYTKINNIEEVVKITPINASDMRKGFITEKTIGNSKIKEKVFLDKSAKAITFDIEIDWQEPGNNKMVPVLIYNFPLNYDTKNYLYNIAGGSQIRQEIQQDVPALKYGAAINTEKKSVVLVSDCKYGFRGFENQLSVTLINSSTSPDLYPELGIHNIKLFVGIESPIPNKLELLATRLTNPLKYISTNKHTGNLPMESSFMNFESETAILSSVELSYDNSILVYFYETSGNKSEINITFDKNIKSANNVDLMENVLSQADIDKNIVKTSVDGFCLGCVKISF